MARKNTKTLQLQCHIHDKVEDKDVENIRNNVCADISDAQLTEFEGRNYCLFHLPTKDKNVGKFEEIFQKRLGLTKKKLAEIENLSEDKIKTDKKNLSYDFRYVWFPSKVNLSEYATEDDSILTGYKFEVGVNFSSATFSKQAYFFATFCADTYFNKATFNQDADFSESYFYGSAFFQEVIFSSEVNFEKTNFFAYTFFSSATFSANTDFSSALFVQTVSFNLARFIETSHICFKETKFCKNVYFQQTIFEGYVTFESENDENIFLEKEDISRVKHHLIERFENWKETQSEIGLNFTLQVPNTFEENQGSVLDLQNARIEKPERILFHNVRLKPSWFINVDCNNFVLSDCVWRKANNKYIDAKSELQALIKREMPKPHKLLRRTSWQLANNYEESKNFYTASLFRQIANESKRLEFFNGFKIFTLHWWYWFSSFYGESWQRAFLILLIIIFALFPLIYRQISFQTCSKDRPIAASLTICESKDEEIRKNCTCSTDQITLTDAIVQSLTTATLQNVEYRKPLTVWGELWIILEKIFAPLQAALLALAIRRKFMR